MSLNSISVDNNNPVPRLSELKLEISALQERDKIEVKPRLRMGSIDILPQNGEEHDFAFKVSLKRVEFRIIVEGGEVDDENRLGEKLKEYARGISSAKLTIEEGIDIKSDQNIGLGSEVSASKISISGTAKLAAARNNNTKKRRQKEVTDDSPISNVTARGDNSWEITDSLEGVLDGSYLEGRRICLVSLTNNSNRTEIRGVVCCSVRDLELEALDSSKRLFKGTNRQKMIKVLVGRRLKDLNQSRESFKEHDSIVISFSYSIDHT